MDEIVNAVVAKTGLSHEIAKIAVLTVISHIKTLLPKVIADQIDSYLGVPPQGAHGHPETATQNPDVVGSVLKGLGGILGKK